ncbi:MAG: hypothetical protein E6R13_05100, partial [Spirochaetes bacterium]
MACKYKYNNNWYSKEELKSILLKERGILPDGKLEKPEIGNIPKTGHTYSVIYKNNTDSIYSGRGKKIASFDNYIEAEKYYLDNKDVYNPTGRIELVADSLKTKENTTSIESVKNRVIVKDDLIGIDILPTTQIDQDWLNSMGLANQSGYMLADYAGELHKDLDIFKTVYKTEQEARKVLDEYEKKNKKEYTSQALVNTKIAKLKEVAKKYPRSLIRSEVRPINSSSNLGFAGDELPFQKISDSSFQQFQQSLNKPNTNPILQGNQEAVITPNDKIVFGHPGIGKTFLRESGRTDVIDFDSDYKSRINEKFGLEKGFKARNDFQKNNKEEYQKAVRELWEEAKQEAFETGKQLFASDMILLREFANDFDKVITMSKETFISRAKQRNDYTPGAEGTEGWKQSLDTAISNVDKSKVVSTDKYLSDLFTNTQQEQVKKFAELQERLNNKEFLEGAKNAFESSEELQNVYYETLGIEQYSEIELKPYATDVWGKVPKQRGDNNFVNKEQYSIKINTENKGIDVRLTIYFDDSNKTAFVSNIENFENDVTHPLKKGLGLKAFLEANRLITKRGYTPVIDNLVSGYGYDMMLKLEKQGYLSKVLNKNISNSQYDNIKYENPPFVFTNKIYEIQITPQQKQNALNAYTDYIARVSLGIIKNPSSGEYNYESQVKDIVYHGTNRKFDKFDLSFNSAWEYNEVAAIFFSNKKEVASNYIIQNSKLLKDKIIVSALLNIKDSITDEHEQAEHKKNSKFKANLERAKKEGKDSYIAKNINDGGLGDVYAVFEPEQIHILGSKQDIEGFKDFVSKSNNNLKPGEQLSLFGLDIQNQANLEFHINTLNVIGQFLENVGIEQRLVTQFLSSDGNIVDGALAAANFVNGTVDIIDDINKRPEAWNKLPEEAAHWWYRLLNENSPLKKALWESHQTALKNDELYKGQYGKLVKSPSDLTEESIGQLIAEAIKRIEEKNAAPEDYSFFKKFLEWINKLLSTFKSIEQDPFEVGAMKILSSDMSDLMTWEEYRKLNNIVNFADVVTAQSVAPIDYTLIDDIGQVNSFDYGIPVFRFDSNDGTKDSPEFRTQVELDNWVSANIKEHNQRQKQILQEVRDNQVFFDRLLNKSFRKKSKFLPKTLRKYFNIIDAQNLNPLREWNISQELQQITKKLSDFEKKQIIETNGYTNIAPTLKVLPD